MRWLTLKRSRATLAALLLVGLTQLEAHSAELPSFAQVRAAHQVSEAWLYDRNGEVLDTLHLDPNAYRLPWIPLRALSPAMRHALLVSEDKRFYQHGGVDWRAFVGAAWENLVYDTHRGASTTRRWRGHPADAAIRKNGIRSRQRAIWKKPGARPRYSKPT